MSKRKISVLSSLLLFLASRGVSAFVAFSHVRAGNLGLAPSSTTITRVQASPEAFAYDVVVNDKIPSVPRGTNEKLDDWIERKRITDLWVICHGWNTGRDVAIANYRKLFGHVMTIIDDHEGVLPKSKNPGLLRVTWPSVSLTSNDRKAFREFVADEQSKKQDSEQIEAFQKVLNYSDLELDDFMVGMVAALPMEEPQDPIQPFGSAFPNRREFSGMKQRAGTIGADLLSKSLEHAMEKSKERGTELRVHLIGHSFGALLVTAAANAAPQGIHYASLFLLQAAFSHSVFADKIPAANNRRGVFRDVIHPNKSISGPVAATWSKNDRAFQDWTLLDLYTALAEQNGYDGSKLFQEDRLVRWGALGGSASKDNDTGGAQHLKDDEVSSVVTTLLKYERSRRPQHAFESDGMFHNLEAHRTVGGHNNVWDNKNVANAIVELTAVPPK